ncbi:hypothetical protein D3C80_1259920 [compost metagenome]
MMSAADRPWRSLNGRMLLSRVLEVCITPLGLPVVPEVYSSCTTSSALGRRSANSLAVSTSSSQARCSSTCSKDCSSSLSITSTCLRSGSSPRRPCSMAWWSKLRKVPGTTTTLLWAWASMYCISCSRKIGISGLHTAPMRTQAMNRALICHQLGNWQDTTSPFSTPSAARPAAMRVMRWFSSL